MATKEFRIVVEGQKGLQMTTEESKRIKEGNKNQ